MRSKLKIFSAAVLCSRVLIVQTRDRARHHGELTRDGRHVRHAFGNLVAAGDPISAGCLYTNVGPPFRVVLLATLSALRPISTEHVDNSSPLLWNKTAYRNGTLDTSI